MVTAEHVPSLSAHIRNQLHLSTIIMASAQTCPTWVCLNAVSVYQIKTGQEDLLPTKVMEQEKCSQSTKKARHLPHKLHVIKVGRDPAKNTKCGNGLLQNAVFHYMSINDDTWGL